MGICSDLVFAIMPISFIWSLNRPVIERILLSALMGLGMIAAMAGAIKFYYIRTWKYGEEAVDETVSVYMWYRVEEISLIAAACAPFLKRPIESMLSRLGLSQFGFVPLGLKTIRSDGRNPSMDVLKGESSTEQQLAQNSGQAASMVSLGRSDHGNDEAKGKRQEMNHAEGA
jgi:hypothetical protein